MLYLFHGDDEFSRAEAVSRLKTEMDPTLGALNTTVLAGRNLRLGELRAASDAIPFMVPWRLVIVEELLGPPPPPGNKASRRAEAIAAADQARLAEILEWLPQAPGTTRLVINESRTLGDRHPLLRRVDEAGGQVQAFAVPAGAELPHWITGRARGLGVDISQPAIQLLTEHIGPNLRLLANELEKLATYLDGRGTIGPAEVEKLVPAEQEADVFHLVGAVGSRDSRRALLLLRRLMDRDRKHPLYLLTMLVRQFRLLLQARELEARGASPQEMAREMEVQPWMPAKLLSQARNFTPGELKAILGELLEIDAGIKTGQADGPLALELFCARWGRGAPRR